MSIANSYNFRQLTPNLSSSGVVGPNRLKGLADEAYECVINLLPNHSEYAVAEEQQAVEQQGLDYIYIPVDWEQPSTADYQATVTALADNQTRKTHIHCAANWRVSGFYSCYAVSEKTWSTEQAREHISGLWQPQKFPQWQALLAELGLTF
jgi:protein tyrosine phosphatase (PTP) superfamily phosphohydrolase (DUF442 family)